MSGRSALVESLRSEIDRTLRPFVQPDAPLALLDFPDHQNVGDSAIWLGALAWLRAHSLRPVYTSDIDTFQPALLARRVGGGTIFLTGGGNLGDTWARHQELRERVIRAFPDNPIVQLPQSLHFRDPSALARARTVFEGHSNLTLLLRDRSSLQFARREFQVPSRLCPDMTFFLGPLARHGQASRDVLWLRRTDRERRPGAGLPVAETGVDWLEHPPTALATYNARLSRWLIAHPWMGFVLRTPLSATYRPLASQRVHYGCRVLSSARTVITDRLHGHILCMLLDIPHVLLDNSNGKIKNFHETWTAGSPLARWADSPHDAVTLAATWHDEGAPAR